MTWISVTRCDADGTHVSRRTTTTVPLRSGGGRRPPDREAAGRHRELTVADGFRFNIDGQQVSVHELKSGMRGTATITTTTTVTPVSVTEVKNCIVVKASGTAIIVLCVANRVSGYFSSNRRLNPMSFRLLSVYHAPANNAGLSRSDGATTADTL
jgi:hypothetical protein